MLHVRMSLQIAADMAQRQQVFLREVAAFRENRIQARSAVALGQNETVAVRILRIFRIDVHFFKIQIRKYVGR